MCWQPCHTINLGVWATNTFNHADGHMLFVTKGELVMRIRDVCNELGIKWYSSSCVCVCVCVCA